jgi:tetratricopeptide (TPR) repeat protein
LLALAVLSSSCAYYNTFYLARKYYFRATGGLPYAYEEMAVKAALGPQAAGQASGNYTKSIDYSKKLLAQYPKSKWMDDAYLLWAQAMIGRDDPLQAINMLSGFDLAYPNSPVSDDALFYLGVAERRARKYETATATFGRFLEKAPKHKLAPYARLERAAAQTSLGDHPSAAATATELLERDPKSPLVPEARKIRAAARLAMGDFDGALEDYRFMGANARTEDERFELLLKEQEALEAAGRYDDALALLRNAMQFEKEPARQDTTGGRALVAPTGPGVDRFGRLLMREGSVHQRAGRLDESLAAYLRVIEDYPKSALASEAQFRIGYAYETVGDDFERARTEYQKVKEQGGSQAFITQAQQRLTSLERLEQFRTAGGDTVQKQAEIHFARAEVYLFQQDRPERALEEYRLVAEEFPGTPYAAKSLNAQAWVLSRKLGRQAEAESLFWEVVRNHPATEAQLAARDYLEAYGREVPASLIVMPKAPEPVIDPADTLRLASPPDSIPLGLPAEGIFATPDSLGRPPRGLGAPVIATGASPPALPDTSSAVSRGGLPPSTSPSAPPTGDAPSGPPELPPAPAAPDTTRRVP